MVLVCLPSDVFSQHLLSYLGFSYLGRGVSLHGCSCKAQPLLLTLDEGYLLSAAPPDLERGVAPLSPPVPGSSHSLEVGLKMETPYTVSKKKRPGADYGSDHELLIAKFRLELKKVGKTTRPFRYDLNQIPYDYTVEVINRFKGLDLIDRKPDEQ